MLHGHNLMDNGYKDCSFVFLVYFAGQYVEYVRIITSTEIVKYLNITTGTVRNRLIVCKNCQGAPTTNNENTKNYFIQKAIQVKLIMFYKQLAKY